MDNEGFVLLKNWRTRISFYLGHTIPIISNPLMQSKIEQLFIKFWKSCLQYNHGISRPLIEIGNSSNLNKYFDLWKMGEIRLPATANPRDKKKMLESGF